MKELLWRHIATVRKKSPLVQSITNYVVMNNTANALLAVGASPIMAHAHPEMKQMPAICQALVINIGTLDEYWVESMLLAIKSANEHKKPWILDPVGAGATAYRDTTLVDLLHLKPTVIRGNASEIMALARYNKAQTKGVDSTAQSEEAIDAARYLFDKFGAVVCISGKTDIILSGDKQMSLYNGDELMTKVTGLGCAATAIIGAFIAVIENKLEAAAAAMVMLGVCGEIAAKNVNGPGSLQVALLDKLYNLTEAEFKDNLKCSTNYE
ncbi:hydroxyethylthiazole kinase [Leeuwenhoekiella sp. A16]|uniref:hydroxyethylthiazole kinase n=1 Tax=Leeuwenhoekiella sp. A16 TaxID=3141462 RepID=UPI003A7F6FC6